MCANRNSLTTPDLVILSLLAERPMHGYEVNAELERRDARDWVDISRPQIYYSLQKLAQKGLLEDGESSEPLLGAERRVLLTSNAGRAMLAQALERETWTTERERPAFLTWLALSWQASPAVVKKQIERRKKFLESELGREKATLRDVRREVGHPYHEAVWMITLAIGQLKLELKWLSTIVRELRHRAPAGARPARQKKERSKPMKKLLLFGLMCAAILSSSLVSGAAQEAVDGRQRIFHDELLDQLVGDWKVTRKLPTRTVENTFKAEWILNHQFLQLHMKDVGPQPGYEALVLIGYDNTSERYVAHWIDIFGGRVSESLGYGTRTGGSIKFVFEYPDGPFINTFTWNAEVKGWSFLMQQKSATGKWEFFAEDRLRRG